MSPDAHIAKYNGQHIASYGGECVANAATDLDDNGLHQFIAYANAVDWFNNPSLAPAFDFVTNNPNDPTQLPPRGALMVWQAGLPGSGGFGHISIFLNSNGDHTFTSFDQNWGGNYCHNVVHSWGYILGWIVLKPSAPAPIPQGGNEVANAQQVQNLYHAILFRDADPGGLANYTGKDANVIVAEMLGSQERKNLEAARANTDTQLQTMQASINTQNATIASVTADDTATHDQLKTALDLVAKDNADLTTAHDKITELTNAPVTPAPVVDPNPVVVGPPSKNKGFWAYVKEFFGIKS